MRSGQQSSWRPEKAADSTEEQQHDFDQLFERYARPVSAFFARRGFSPEDCRDLTQETLLGVHKGMDRFRAESSQETWLFSIAANVWRNQLRSRSAGKRRGKEISLEGLRESSRLPEHSEPRDPANPLAEVLEQERTILLRAALEGLPGQMRRCLQLRLGPQKLKYREIAEVMQISIQTVKSQISQGKGRLKRSLAEHFPELREEGSSD